ncbi:hypothetical protein ACHAXN_001298 [Cyclotella atomus]
MRMCKVMLYIIQTGSSIGRVPMMDITRSICEINPMAIYLWMWRTVAKLNFLGMKPVARKSQWFMVLPIIWRSYLL